MSSFIVYFQPTSQPTTFTLNQIQASPKAVSRLPPTVHALLNTIPASLKVVHALLNTLHASPKMLNPSLKSVHASLNVIQQYLNAVHLPVFIEFWSKMRD